MCNNYLLYCPNFHNKIYTLFVYGIMNSSYLITKCTLVQNIIFHLHLHLLRMRTETNLFTSDKKFTHDLKFC